MTTALKNKLLVSAFGVICAGVLTFNVAEAHTNSEIDRVEIYAKELRKYGEIVYPTICAGEGNLAETWAGHRDDGIDEDRGMAILQEIGEAGKLNYEYLVQTVHNRLSAYTPATAKSVIIAECLTEFEDAMSTNGK